MSPAVWESQGVRGDTAPRVHRDLAAKAKRQLGEEAGERERERERAASFTPVDVKKLCVVT